MERTRSRPFTKEEGREPAAAAAGPLPLSLGSAAAEGFGENPARSSRLSGACAASLLAFLRRSVPSRPRVGERATMKFTRGCKIGLSPRPRPPRPRPDPLAAGLVSWLLLSTSTALCFFKTFYKPAPKNQLSLTVYPFARNDRSLF